MSDRHEARLLLAVLREDWSEAERLAASRAPDPATFVGLCRRCDVLPSVHAALERGGRLSLVGERAAADLGEARRKCRMDNLLLLARVERALDALREAGIVPVVLKGLDVLHRFGVGFDARTLDDADLLVAKADFPRAAEALEAAGWSGPAEPERTHWLRSSHEMPLRSPGPVEVAFELHWDLGQEKRYRIPMDEVLARAVPLRVAGRDALRLEDHDAAAHLLLHHLQHYFDRRLKWALDLGRIAAEPGFRWDEVASRLARWEGLGAAGLSRLHLDKLFPGLLPEAAAGALPAAAWRRLAILPLRSSHPLDLVRGSRRRPVQLWLAAAAFERPGALPAYLLHRGSRDRRGPTGGGR